MNLARCNDCKACWTFALSLEELVCPFCFKSLKVEGCQAETASCTDIEILEQQLKAHKGREAALRPKPSISSEGIEEILGLSSGSVQGELDVETGRFYVRSIRGPKGFLDFAVSRGFPCVLRMEKT